VTTTITPADLDDVVRRADDRWARRHGDEPAAPEYLQQIIDAVRLLLGQPAPADDVQVRQLLADKQRLTDLVEELRKQADTRGKVVERQVREIAALKKDLESADADARRRVDVAAATMEEPLRVAEKEANRLREALVLRTQELDDARAQLRNRPAADPTREKLVAAAAEVTTREKLAAAGADVERLTGEVARLTEQLAAREVPEHSCLYPIAEPGAEPGPCEMCQRPYPRSADAYELEDDVPPTVEPWAALFGQIRDEAKKAGWKA